MGREAVIVCVLLALLPLAAWSKPMGGKYTGSRALTQVLTEDKSNHNTSCRSLALYNSGKIFLRAKKGDEKSTVRITVTIFRSKCANFLDCPSSADSIGQYYTRVYSSSTTMKSQTAIFLFSFEPMATTPPPPQPSQPPPVSPTNASNTTVDSSPKQSRRAASEDKEAESPGIEGASTGNGEEPVENGESSDKANGDGKEPVKSGTQPHYTVNSSGVYMMLIASDVVDSSKVDQIELKFGLEMKNYYGYLSAIDYPALVFYGLMTAIYGIMGIAWSVAMCCSYKDLVRLQFWVFAVIILGFLEKTFFVSEYSSINQGEDSSFLILLAEGISAAKRALARMMLIIVSLGFGTVKPRLGDSLGKVVAVGVIYFVFALIDGIVRAKADTFNTQDTSQVVTLALLFIMDSIIFYWIFTSLVSVRRALRLRKNYVKLSMYNHFAYTLIFAIVAALAFTVWMFVEVNYPKDGCLKDWQEVWLRECFWHFLFCFILIVVMIIWRPSANRNRFAYSLVNDLDEEEEEEPEHGENKNFETVKMRTISKSDATPPPVSSQAEDDLRWVEENLPTTAMDKALPLILDSDEEIMNTKFEASKMN